MRMSPEEPLGDALKRMALEQLAIARRGFTLPHEDEVLDATVHLARKASKRTRALLRLVRDDVGRDTYRNENAVLRDQSQRLSDVRIARVLVNTYDSLLADEPHPGSVGGLETVGEQLAAHHAAAVAWLRADLDGMAAARLALDCARSRFTSWQPPAAYATQGPVALEKRIGHQYRRSRKALTTAAHSGKPSDFHEWRKRVNYLRYQLEALSGVAGPTVGRLALELDELSEILGDAHDLADLVKYLEATPAPLPAQQLAALRDAANVRRERLEATAVDTGQPLFRLSRSGFMEGLSGKWLRPAR